MTKYAIVNICVETEASAEVVVQTIEEQIHKEVNPLNIQPPMLYSNSIISASLTK